MEGNQGSQLQQGPLDGKGSRWSTLKFDKDVGPGLGFEECVHVAKDLGMVWLSAPFVMQLARSEHGDLTPMWQCEEAPVAALVSSLLFGRLQERFRVAHEGLRIKNKAGGVCKLSAYTDKRGPVTARAYVI